MKTMKKMLALLLSVSLIVSGSAFLLAARAETTVTVDSNAQYRVRILIVEDDAFLPSSNDVAYQNTTAINDYAVVTYAKNNGTATATSTLRFNLGDENGVNKNIVSLAGENYGYFPSNDGILIDGFPTKFKTVYYKDTNNAWPFGTDTSGSYYAYFQIAKVENNGTLNWDAYGGTCTEKSGIGTGIVGGYCTDECKKGVASGHGSIDANTNGGIGNIIVEEDVPVTAYPKAQNANISVSYSEERVSAPSSADDDAAANTLTVPAMKDQYNSNMSYTISVNGDQNGTDGLSQVGKTTYVGYGANVLLSGINSQIISAGIIWDQKDSSSVVAIYPTFVTDDATYTVEWKNESGTAFATSTYSFGETPNNTVPTKAFDADYHYLNPHWDHAYEAVTDTSNNIYTAAYDATAHQYTEFMDNKDDDDTHYAKCYVDPANIHFETLPHTYTQEVIPATCISGGFTRFTCTGCGKAYETNQTTMIDHTLGAYVQTLAPTCETNGVKTAYCQTPGCTYTKTQPITKLYHKTHVYSIAPTDAANGGVCMECERCNRYFCAVYDSVNNKYKTAGQTTYDTAQVAVKLSDSTVPAPTFNTFVNAQFGLDYSKRGASLKYANLSDKTKQPMRFTGAVALPDDVSYMLGTEGNVITDFGFVFAGTDEISDISDLILGSVRNMSVKDRNKNAGIFTGENWGGVSLHESGGKTYLTFNLLFDLESSSWNKSIAVRPYLTYTYNGISYTVYDHAYTTRSVLQVANMIINNPNEKPAAIEYCTEKFSHLL